MSKEPSIEQVISFLIGVGLLIFGICISPHWVAVLMCSYIFFTFADTDDRRK